jgi:hypothetical protein
MQHYKKRLDGMVICGSGPHLNNELEGSQRFAGFPDPDLIDRSAHSVCRLLTPLLPMMSLITDYLSQAVVVITGSL